MNVDRWWPPGLSAWTLEVYSGDERDWGDELRDRPFPDWSGATRRHADGSIAAHVSWVRGSGWRWFVRVPEDVGGATIKRGGAPTRSRAQRCADRALRGAVFATRKQVDRLLALAERLP